jgi:anti-sigma factor RsiW
MECFEVRKRLNAWVDDELPVNEAQGITHHLRQCPACRLEAKGIQQIVASLDELPTIHAPDYLSRRTLSAFRANLDKLGIVEWWQGLNLALRGAVCGATLAGLLCGAVLGTSMSTLVVDDYANPYQALYASKGILP